MSVVAVAAAVAISVVVHQAINLVPDPAGLATHTGEENCIHRVVLTHLHIREQIKESV